MGRIEPLIFLLGYGIFFQVNVLSPKVWEYGDECVSPAACRVCPQGARTHRRACRAGKTAVCGNSLIYDLRGTPMSTVGDMARSQAQLSRFGKQDQGNEQCLSPGSAICCPGIDTPRGQVPLLPLGSTKPALFPTALGVNHSSFSGEGSTPVLRLPSARPRVWDRAARA